jgi:high affinity sulfate transporter 1
VSDEAGTPGPTPPPRPQRAGRIRIGPEALAALTLLAIAVPEQLATSRLAGMPPITGLYAFVAGSIAFFVLGSNPQLSVGADSTIAPLFAVALARLAPTQSPHYVALAGILALVVGVLVAAVGLLRLGWIAQFLSVPIVTGFLAGVAVIIVVHQLPDLLGLPAASGSTVHRVADALGHLPQGNWWAAGIAAGALAVLFASESIDRRLPGALLALALATAVVAIGGLRAHGVAVLGAFAHAAPPLGVRDLSWTTLGQVFPASAVVALVVLSQSAATSRAFADIHDLQVDMNRDFVGVGAGSVLAGLTGSFAVNASPARTAAVAAAGGRTKVAGLVAAGAVVLFVPGAGVLHDVPVAVLGAVLVFVAVRLFRLHDLVALARFDLVELGLALVTLVVVALVGVEQGITVAVLLAILDRTRRSAQPSVHLLGRIPGSTSWEPLSAPGDHEEVPGVGVLLFAAPLYYANAEHFRAQVEAAVARIGEHPQSLVLDVLGMHDIDFTGARVLGRILDELGRRHVTVGIARAGAHLHDNLDRSGLLGSIGASHFYSSVDEAVTALAPG